MDQLQCDFDNAVREFDTVSYGLGILVDLSQTMNEKDLSVALLTFVEKQNLSSILPSEISSCFDEVSVENTFVVCNTITDKVATTIKKLWGFLISIAEKIKELFFKIIDKLTKLKKNVGKRIRSLLGVLSKYEAAALTEMFANSKGQIMEAHKIKSYTEAINEGIAIDSLEYVNLSETTPNLNLPELVIMRTIMQKIECSITHNLVITNRRPEAQFAMASLNELGYNEVVIKDLKEYVENIDLDSLKKTQTNAAEKLKSAVNFFVDQSVSATADLLKQQKLAKVGSPEHKDLTRKINTLSIKEKLKVSNVKKWQSIYNGYYRQLINKQLLVINTVDKLVTIVDNTLKKL